MIHLEKLVNRSILELVFKPSSPISVGMYNEGNIRKIAYYMKNGKIIPLIPSESIKGVMRSIASLISYSMNDPIARYCNKGIHTNATGIDEEGDKLRSIFTTEQLQELSEDNKNNLILSLKCHICRLFGSNMLAAKLIFSDMEVYTNEIFTYTSNSIDRKDGIALERHLFTLEYILPSELSLRIIANNISHPENYLFANLLRYICKKGLQIGGLKSKGYGLIELDKEKSKFKVLEFKKPASEEDILYNVNTLLLRNNVKEYSIENYINYIEREYDHL